MLKKLHYWFIIAIIIIVIIIIIIIDIIIIIIIRNHLIHSPKSLQSLFSKLFVHFPVSNPILLVEHSPVMIRIFW